MNDKLEQDLNTFIQKSEEEVLKHFGGSLQDWAQTFPMKVDNRKIEGHKMYFVKVDDIKLEYIECTSYIQKKDQYEGFESFKTYYPFKNIKKIIIKPIRTLVVYDSMKNTVFNFSLGNENMLEIISEKYNKFYESNHGKMLFSKADEINKLKDLLVEGTITEVEFNTFKNELLE